MAAIASYLNPGRLADVLALIQVLAFDRDTSRSEDGLQDELQRKPVDGGSWMTLCQEHPELFRVRADEPGKKQRAALLARYVREHEETAGGDEKRPPLEPAVANKLMELAIQLHDKQLERKTRWRSVVLPMGVALIAAGASIGAAIINASKPSANAVQQQVQGPTSPPSAGPRP